MPTRFEYLYRDASNFKRWGSVVFRGTPSDEIERRLRGAFEGSEFFIADQVRVPELFLDQFPFNEDDHCWHAFSRIEPTDDEPDDAHDRTVEEFAVEFENAASRGWRVFDPMRRAAGRAVESIH